MQEPWEYFADAITRRMEAIPTDRGTADAVRLPVIRAAAEDSIAWLTAEQGWPWAAARILTAKLVDRAIVWTFLEESLASLRGDLRLIWLAERAERPEQAVWARLLAPLVGTHAAGAPDPARPLQPAPS